jgi:hypothetical protein
MYVSFDDGSHWQSFQQNLPTTSYRDLAIKGNDLVAATYGRGIWLLDDYAALRQITPALASEPAHLFKPGDAVRVRRNVGADTPFPPEVPHALNPATGVIVDYWLARAASNDITLDVLDAAGNVVRHLSSAAITPVPEAAKPPEPNFWLATPSPLPVNAGTNRTNWNLRYDSPPVFRHSFEINANPGQTPVSPQGPVALPGVYTLRLTADGHRYTQTVTVRPDPRSPATPVALAAQHTLQMNIMQGLRASYAGHQAALALRDALHGAVPAGTQGPELAEVASRAAAFAAQLDTVAGLDAGGRFRGRGGRAAAPSFIGINGALASQLTTQEQGDMAPTPAMVAEYASTCHELSSVITAWQRLSTTELGTFNGMLKQRGRPALTVSGEAVKAPSCS